MKNHTLRNIYLNIQVIALSQQVEKGASRVEAESRAERKAEFHQR